MTYMPAMFVGHGSPMNAIEQNEFTKGWAQIANTIPMPEAILVISAHWYTDGTRVIDEDNPKTIHDFYGFPDELYKIEYNAAGAPWLAHKIRDIVGIEVAVDNSWGFDHGAWSVLRIMYPKANIPVCQLSIDKKAKANIHFDLGKKIKELRKEGVLILGSGNVVHNLERVDFSKKDGYDWAYQFDDYVRDKIIKRDYSGVIDCRKAGKSSDIAFTIPDHYYPLLYILGASDLNDEITVFNDSCVYGGLSMTSYMFSGK
jgi:4,5-DOPA dioxygenase extradiol